VTAVIQASAVRTCLGGGAETFDALTSGRAGVGPLRDVDAEALGVTSAYQVGDGNVLGSRFRASALLQACVAEALDQSGVDPAHSRVVALVGTGLRELRELERWDAGGSMPPASALHFAAAVRAAAPEVEEVITLSNACSAGGHALALAQDLVELGEADAVIAAGTDSITESMLAMIGRVSTGPADQLRPFDESRGGALLGEGAVAMVVGPDEPGAPALARLLATGMSCDAHHETAAELDGIVRAVDEAFARAERSPDEVDVVVAHGTGTAINDPLESTLLESTFGCGPRPLVTAIKGAVGHTSGAAALMAVDVAIRCLQTGLVPPIVGLRRRIPEAAGLALVERETQAATLRMAQVNAFGFGGVNAVTLLEAAA
jgi:3-oxoacyl-[acyl-carrier-protein] synthase II